MACCFSPSALRVGFCLLAMGAFACTRTFRLVEMERSSSGFVCTTQKAAEEQAAMEATFAPQPPPYPAWEDALTAIGLALERAANANELRPEMELHYAAWVSDLNPLQEQAERNDCCIDSVVSTEGVTPLHLAVFRGMDNCIQLLLNHQAAVSLGMQTSKIQPIHIAASQGNVSVLMRLLRAGASVKAIDATGRTALHWAAIRGSTGCIHELLQAGSFLNRSDDSNDTPLCLALRYGHASAVKQLIQAGGVVDCLHCMGGSSDYIARWALVHGYDSCLEALTNSGTVSLDCQKKDAYGTTLWQLALRRKRRIGLQCLLRRKAGLDYRDAQGNTLFHLALQEGFTGSLDLLAAHLPDLLNTPNHVDETPLHRAAAYQNVEATRVLLAAEADVHAKNTCGDTPLHKAVLLRQVEAVRALLAARADVNAKNDQDRTPLHVAVVVYKNIETLRALLSAGADVNTKSRYDDTPLHKAVLFGHVEAVRALLAAGADVNAKNVCGDTPLHVAAASDQNATLPALLSAGAEVNAKNKNGDTPLEIAQSKGYFGIVDLLRQAGAC